MVASVALLWVIAAFGFARYRDMLYPGFLQPCVWAVVATFFALFSDDFDPVSLTTWLMFVTCCAAFCIGCLITTGRHKPNMEPTRPGTMPSIWIGYLLLAVAVLLLPAMYARAQDLAAIGKGANQLANVRMLLKKSGNGYGALAYAAPTAYFTAALFQLRFLSRPNWRDAITGVIAVGVALAYGILTTGRGALFMPICILFCIPMVLRAWQPSRALTLLVVVGTSLFVIFGLVIGKGGNAKQGFDKNLSTMSRSLETYFLAALPAFSQSVEFGSPNDGGANSMRSLVAIGQTIGYDMEPKELVQPFTHVPMFTNVYTVYQPYFDDWGLGVLPLFMLAFGALHGFLYKRATRANPAAIYLFLFAASFYPLLLQIFQDVYLTNLSLWLQYALYGIVGLVICAERSRRAPALRGLRYEQYAMLYGDGPPTAPAQRAR